MEKGREGKRKVRKKNGREFEERGLDMMISIVVRRHGVYKAIRF